jgi:hypothetical protein
VARHVNDGKDLDQAIGDAVKDMVRKAAKRRGPRLLETDGVAEGILADPSDGSFELIAELEAECLLLLRVPRSDRLNIRTRFRSKDQFQLAGQSSASNSSQVWPTPGLSRAASSRPLSSS